MVTRMQPKVQPQIENLQSQNQVKKESNAKKIFISVLVFFTIIFMVIVSLIIIRFIFIKTPTSSEFFCL